MGQNVDGPGPLPQTTLPSHLLSGCSDRTSLVAKDIRYFVESGIWQGQGGARSVTSLGGGAFWSTPHRMVT